MAKKRENPIPKYKLETVKELGNLIKNNKTILIASIKNIPGSQFQEIVKKLRDKAVVKVPKKSLILRAIDSSENKEVKKLGEKIEDGFAILFSDLDSYELAGELLKNTSPSKAKPGQEAPEDIQIEEGPTDLVPGPAISELGALGIQIQIEKGKIHIKQAKVIARAGEKISKGAAELMAKLDIKPFKVGFIPLCAFDTLESKLYEEINIDPEATITELKEAYSKALGFAIEIGYTTEDTIKLLLSRAVAHERKLTRIITGEPQGWASAPRRGENLSEASSRPEPVAEVPVTETPKEIQEKKKEEPRQEDKSSTSLKQSDDSSPKADAGAGLASLFG